MHPISILRPSHRRFSPGPLSLVLSIAALAVCFAAAPLEGIEEVPLLITVDDLPLMLPDFHPDPKERLRITQGMLEVLARHQVPAVGLVTWGRYEDAESRQLLELWLEAGHELGNHTVLQLDYNRTDIETYRADAEEGRRRLDELLAPHGKKPRFFRFPQLHEGDTEEKLVAMREYLQASGQRSLPVTLDSLDWSFERRWVQARLAVNARALERLGREYQDSLRLAVGTYRRLGEELLGRPVPQILLLHGGEVGVAQWDSFFTWLRQEGFRFATADEVLADVAYSEMPSYFGPLGASLWDRLADGRRREEAEREVRTLLVEQAGAWSRGDLEAFCSVYAEDTAFVSPTGLTRGRQQVLERYRKRYPGWDAMGRLELEILELRLATGIESSAFGDRRLSGVHGASVVARWSLSYPDRDELTGLTLLVLSKNGAGEWRIVQDASM